MKKNTNLNIRISKELHDEIKKEAIRISVQENDLITISDVIRQILNEKFKTNEK